MPLLDRSPAGPETLPARLSAFGLLYCTLHVGVTFVDTPFGWGLSIGDWISLLTPLAVMGSAFLVFDSTDRSSVADRTLARRLLLASAGLYSMGLGINLSANAIARFLDESLPTQPAALTYFLDEHLGHIVWHLGMVGVSAALLLAARGLPERRLGVATVMGALAYAFAWFTDAVEGQTVPLLLTTRVIFTAILLVQHAAARSLIGRFLLLGHGCALILFGIWFVWQGGFPQFTEVWSL